ncbi:ABC transporter permease [Microbacterium sp. 2MCAF23]|uniref:ABC transporter permease n=1 Tax=Microbacterium sp. 2MCAF23 TaxID=3232985 RepID=UPI003F9DB717
MWRRIGTAMLGIVILLGAAELIGRFQLAGPTWPPLTTVVQYATTEPGRTILLRAVQVSVGEALTGLLIGTVVGLASAAIGMLVPWLRPGMNQLAILLSTVPLIALGPILVTTVGSDGTPTIIAALGAGFAVFVAMSSALTRPTGGLGDVFSALGASRLTILGMLRLPAAVPAFFDGLALAAPAAILGAVVGEWFGAPRGIGVLLVTSMQNYAIPQLWAAAMCVALVSLIVYGLLVGARRLAFRRFA